MMMARYCPEAYAKVFIRFESAVFTKKMKAVETIKEITRTGETFLKMSWGKLLSILEALLNLNIICIITAKGRSKKTQR